MALRDEMKFTYPEVGATRTLDLPAGYRTLQVRTLVGHGPDATRAATDAVMEWSMHRAIPLRIDASAARAAPGVDVTVHLGLIRAPCRIVWVEETERWAGWAYGTLLGHPECGEEAFVLHRDNEDEVLAHRHRIQPTCRLVHACRGPAGPAPSTRLRSPLRPGPVPLDPTLCDSLRLPTQPLEVASSRLPAPT